MSNPSPPQRHSFEALGSVWWIEAAMDSETLDSVMRIAHEFDDAYSRFKKGSYIDRLNTYKQLTKPPAELVAMMQFGLQAADDTSGLFNVTAGGVLTTQGYGALHASGDHALVADPRAAIEVSEENIAIDDSVTIDLGGFGKGWLVDKLYALLLDAGCTTVVVNGGGDIRVHSAKPLLVPLMMPGDSNKFFAKASLNSGAIASSSPLLRAWGAHNHLVDSSGLSYAGDVTQLSVSAATAAYADMAATACIIAPDPFKMAAKLHVDILVVRVDGSYEATPQFPVTKR